MNNKKLILLNAAKISFGCVAAIIISNLLGVKYSVTTGLVTVLSIQNTKKETAITALKRLVAFITAILISFLCFTFVGYNTYAFGLYIFCFIILCQFLGFQSAIVPVSVLITHILAEKSFSPEIILNEFLILLIGAGTGVLINMYLRKNVKKMTENREALDNEIKAILGRMSDRILIDDKSDYNGECFRKIEQLMTNARNTAVTNRDNTLFSPAGYDILYLDMRDKQCKILYEMYKDVKELNATPEQANVVSELLKKISNEYHETNNVKDLIEATNDIIKSMKTQKMPETRIEFENRAVLYALLLKTKEFLSIKYMFINNQ